jgi:hypothetical protein
MSQTESFVVEQEAGEGPTAYELTLSGQIAEALNKHYPLHLWAVTVNSRGGVCDVMNLRLSGRWGFRLFLNDLWSASQIERQAMLAGGELLERYRQRPGIANPELILHQPVDFSGNYIPEN